MLAANVLFPFLLSVIFALKQYFINEYQRGSVVPFFVSGYYYLRYLNRPFVYFFLFVWDSVTDYVIIRIPDETFAFKIPCTNK